MSQCVIVASLDGEFRGGCGERGHGAKTVMVVRTEITIGRRQNSRVLDHGENPWNGGRDRRGEALGGPKLVSGSGAQCSRLAFRIRRLAARDGCKDRVGIGNGG